MDLASPISSLIPSAHGPVLVAIARAGRPLSGRQIAALVAGQVGRSRVNSVLAELAVSGIVIREPHPPSVLYSLNRQHLAAPIVSALADLRHMLLERMRAEVAAWPRRADAVWLYGSAARGDGTPTSDIDVLVVRPNQIGEEDEQWRHQVSDLAHNVRVWTGNECEVLELSRDELTLRVTPHGRLARELRRDALVLGGEAPHAVLG